MYHFQKWAEGSWWLPTGLFENFHGLYGRKMLVSNLHFHLHLKECIEDYGQHTCTISINSLTHKLHISTTWSTCIPHIGHREGWNQVLSTQWKFSTWQSRNQYTTATKNSKETNHGEQLWQPKSAATVQSMYGPEDTPDSLSSLITTSKHVTIENQMYGSVESRQKFLGTCWTVSIQHNRGTAQQHRQEWAHHLLKHVKLSRFWRPLQSVWDHQKDYIGWDATVTIIISPYHSMVKLVV